MSLNVSVEPKEDRQLTMKIEVDQGRVDQELRKAARKVAREYRIPGFRPGKAPYSVLVQYVGLPTLFNEFIEPLGEELYKQALEQEGIEPYAQAALDIASLEPLTYELTIPLEPEIDLGDYRSLRVEQKPLEIEDSEIEEELQELRQEHSEWKDVERPSEWGDVMVIDVKSVIIPEEDEAADAEETVVLDETEWDVTLDEENPLEPAGFDEELLGLRPGEEKEFVLEWPADSQSIYRGKKARFQVKVHKIQGYEAPELNDEFAQLIGPDFETLDDLRNHLRESLESERSQDAENEFLSEALDKLVEQSTLVYPPAVVEDQIDSMVNEFDRQLRQYGIDGVESFLQRSGQSMEDYRAGLREQAEKEAQRGLVISEIYRLEGIEVTEEDLEERIQLMLGGPDAEADAPELDAVDAADEAEAGADALDADDNVTGEMEAAAEDAAENAEVTASAANATDADEEDVSDTDSDDAEGDEDAGETPAARDEQAEAFRNLMLQGPGRQILESQILHQKALERLRAIAAGEELPPLPEKQPETSAADSSETDSEESNGESGEKPLEASSRQD
jgi:trigger factor